MSELDSPDTSGRHPVNIGHLVMGVALLALVGVWALWQGDVVADDDVRWLMPVPWVLAGAVGLVASAVTGTRRHSIRQSGWAGQPQQPAQQSEQTETTYETEENQR